MSGLPGRFTDTLLMRMSLTGRAGRSSRVARYTLSTDRVTRSRGFPKTPCALMVWPRQEITDVAAVDLLLDLLVAQGEQVGLDDRQQRVVRDAGREPLGRPDHGAHVDAAAQELLQDAAAGPPGAAEEQHRRLGAGCGGVHHFSFGYWNTSSSGTSNTRAIWKAISSDGE